MRAILDEQLSPQIAALLRTAGYDVDAVAGRTDLVGYPDQVVQRPIRPARIKYHVSSSRHLRRDSRVRHAGQLPCVVMTMRSDSTSCAGAGAIPLRSRGGNGIGISRQAVLASVRL